jgi:predicted dehydrogenase
MPLKIAIAGAGNIAAVHAQAVQNQGGEVVAVIEKYANKATTFANKFRIKNQYATLEEALAEAKFDALVIGTPNFLHEPQTLTALQAGIPVMVEKPMAMTVAESEAVLEASLRTGGILQVAHCWRFDEDVLWLKAQTKTLGKIVRTRGYGVHNSDWGPGGWFTQKQLSGGGALLDMGIHALDTTRFLLGDPQPVSVFARIGTYYQEIDVDDTGVILITWDNGTTSYIESGWRQPYADGSLAGTQLYGTQGFGQLFPTRLLLPNTTAQKGLDQQFPFRLLPGRLRARLRPPKVREIPSGFRFPRKGPHCQQSMYDRQMAHFFECIHTGHTPTPGAQEGLVNMKVVEAAYESATTEQVVDISGAKPIKTTAIS